MRSSFIIVATALGFVSTSAEAQSLAYRFGIWDLGGIPGGTLGNPITWTGPGDNRAFTTAAGSLNPPTADQIDLSPRLRWDDYFMTDPVGQSVGGDPGVEGDGYSAIAPSVRISTSFGPGMAEGVAYPIGADGFGGSPAGPDGRFYLMNITLRVGSSAPTTEGVYVAIFREGGVNETIVFRSLRFGIENATNITENPMVTSQRYYYLDYIATPVPASELPASFGAGINYQIFLAQTDIPAPASASFLFGAGVVALRRRR